ncbi:MAG: hypothetical protein U9R75_06170 [Candidatus Thermoplasmatota archaeon]|nr:hypothetical protein [Candidatus Thermoplasmatota archaeon]
MGRVRTISILSLAVMMLFSSVYGQVSHEDYDKARIDVVAVRYYVRSTLNELNLTLEAMLIDDNGSAVEHLDLFSNRIDDISETLERIPENVDSYSILVEFEGGLISARDNATELVSAFTDVLWAINVFGEIDLSSWNISLMKEELMNLNRALSLFSPSLNIMRDELNDLDIDLSRMQDQGLSVSNQRSLLVEISGHVIDLEMNGTSPEIVGPILMNGLLPPWDEALSDLASEMDANTTLGERTVVLSTIVSDLSGGLEGIVDVIATRMYSTFEGITSFRGNQISFLSSMDILENDSFDDLGLKYSLYGVTEQHLVEMEDEVMTQMGTSLWAEAYDVGTPDRNLSRLNELVETYRDRLDDYSPLISQLEELAGEVSYLQQMNVFDPDPNNDGNISFEEIGYMELPSGLFEQLENVSGLNRDVKDQLELIGPPWNEVLSELYFPLNITSSSTAEFSRKHLSFIETISSMEILNVRSGEMENVKLLIQALTDLPGLYSELEAMEEASSLVNGSEIGMDTSALPDLRDQLEMYKDLLLSLAHEYNVTGLFLDVPSDPIPYDAHFKISILLMNRAIDDSIGMLDGERVQISIDGRNITNITTVKGIGSAYIEVSRNWSLEKHNVSAYHEKSMKWSNSTFTIRRINTKLFMRSDILVLEPNETTMIHISGKDELGRNLPGPVLFNKEEVMIGYGASIEHHFDRTGEQTVPAVFEGDNWTAPSSSCLLYNVSFPSEILLILEEGTVLLNETVNGSANLLFGEGNISLSMGNLTMELGKLRTGENSSFSVQAGDLGIGLHRVQLTHMTHVNRSRDGKSNVLWVLVQEPPETEEPAMNDTPVDKDDDDTNDDDDDTNDDEIPSMEKAFKVLALVMLVTLVLAIAFLFIRRRWKTGDRMKFAVPVPKRTTVKVQAIEQILDENVNAARAKPLAPDLSKARALIEKERSDPLRDTVIASYLEVIDRSPERIGLRRSNTPREVWSNLSRSGADRASSTSLVTNFEEALYREGSPSRERADHVRSSAGMIISWFREIDRQDDTRTE